MDSVKQYLHDAVYQIRPFPWQANTILLTLLPFVLIFSWGFYLADDTYLSIRYAQSLAAGNFAQQLAASGALWTISPLYTALLTVCALLNLPLTTAAVFCGAIGWGMVAIVCTRLLRQLGYFTIAVFTPLLLLVSPWLFLSIGSHVSWVLAVG